jgi:hypothetical protein
MNERTADIRGRFKKEASCKWRWPVKVNVTSDSGKIKLRTGAKHDSNCGLDLKLILKGWKVLRRKVI